MMMMMQAILLATVYVAITVPYRAAFNDNTTSTCSGLMETKRQKDKKTKRQKDKKTKRQKDKKKKEKKTKKLKHKNIKTKRKSDENTKGDIIVLISHEICGSGTRG